MRVRISREYIPVLAAFMAKDDVRYYLNGFHVKAHPENGIILTATDGHRLVTIHDEDGLTDGEYIFPISKNLLAASKKRTDKKTAFPSQWVQYIDNRFVVCPELENHTQDGFLVDETIYQAAAQYVEYVAPIDGVFPDVGGKVIQKLKPEPTSLVGFNTSYMADLKWLSSSTSFPAVDMVLCGQTNAIVIVGGSKREMVAAVMPCRVNLNSINDFVLPPFAKISGHQKSEEELAADEAKTVDIKVNAPALQDAIKEAVTDE